MAEFVTVMPEFMRLCNSFEHCKDCPVNQAGFSCDCDYQGYSKTGAAELEHIIMTWAAEHPEPEYPTWAKWLEEMGIIQIQWNGPVLASMRIGVDDTEYIPVKMKMLEHIPADIAQKLGIEPKEG